MILFERGVKSDKSIEENKVSHVVDENKDSNNLEQVSEGNGINAIIEDSKEQLKQIDPPKKKRAGRPKGSGRKSKSEPTPETNPVFAPLLAGAIKVVPFGILASTLKDDCFLATDQEAKDLGLLADQIIQIYLPKVEDNKHAALYLGVGTLVAMIIGKTTVYLQHKKANEKGDLVNNEVQ